MGTKAAPAAEPSTKRAAKRSGPAGASSGRVRSAAGEGPGVRLVPLTAIAYGVCAFAYQSGARAVVRTSSNPAVRNQRSYSPAGGNSIHVLASARAIRLAGGTGPISSAVPPGLVTR